MYSFISIILLVSKPLVGSSIINSFGFPINADNKDALSHIYESLNSFKNSIKEKAEDIALNPMDYVNNKIIAYKNPLRSFPDPYNLSAYTGMMFNGYI